jgi:hypothetical protein
VVLQKIEEGLRMGRQEEDEEPLRSEERGEGQSRGRVSGGVRLRRAVRGRRVVVLQKGREGLRVGGEEEDEEPLQEEGRRRKEKGEGRLPRRVLRHVMCKLVVVVF